jgi:hypothetical protein
MKSSSICTQSYKAPWFETRSFGALTMRLWGGGAEVEFAEHGSAVGEFVFGLSRSNARSRQVFTPARARSP